MRLLPRRERTSDSDQPRRTATHREQATSSRLFRLGRALFGGVMAFMAYDNLRDLDGSVAYAESKGAPAADVSVPAISAGLLFGGAGVALWRRPAMAAAAVASFFVTVTPVMHDFWTIDDPEQRQQQQIHFLKNSALLGAALALLALGRQED